MHVKSCNINNSSVEMAAENVLLEIIVGTYEQYLIGFKLVEIGEKSYEFQQSFSNHAHIQSVRCISSSDKFMASGSPDETVQLFNMRTRQEIGSLQHHNGTITGMEFHKNFLFTCSEDKTIVIWSIKNWQCEKTLSGHKEAVNDISVHPSGKLLLSVSKDKALRTWNLIKGRSAYVTNIKKVADFVQWSPEGNFFLIGCENTIDVYSLETAAVIHKIEFGKRVSTVAFLDNNICAVGGDCEDIQLHDLESKTNVLTFHAHSNRIKSLKFVPSPHKSEKWLVSISSDGFIKVFQIKLKKIEKQPTLITEVDTTCRPTCMTIVENV